MAKLKKWHVYIVECKDNLLYTGITNNLERRLKQHNSGCGCRFTKYRFPVKLLYNERQVSRSLALVREAGIKRLPRKKKLELAGINNPSSARKSPRKAGH